MNLCLLWVDDEIDLLVPYIHLLKQKGYDVLTASNGNDALNIILNKTVDIVILDENMPGLTGVRVLEELKKVKPHLPVIMFTKSEEENIMNTAIGANIADYLIKPVNPNQLLLSIKKIVEKHRLVEEYSLQHYQSNFNQLSQEIAMSNDIESWKNVYKKIVYYDIQLQQADLPEMNKILEAQKKDANNNFSKFIKNKYLNWFSNPGTLPLISSNLLQKRFFPLLKKHQKVILLVLDNLRYDHWEVLSKQLFTFFSIETDLYLSILPSTTSYARNALFAGLMPSEIEKVYPDIWKNDDDEGLKNLYEEELFQKQCQRLGVNETFFFKKIISNNDGKSFLENINHFVKNYNKGVVIYNFIDILSHSQVESKTLRELANNDITYRNLVNSWFEYSPLYEILKRFAEHQYVIFLTTDHGSIQIENPIKVIGERNLNVNLRYKQGRNMNYNPKEVFEIKDPSKAYLPRIMVSASYIFATNKDFFVYPNNFSQYYQLYRYSFQHGGVSLEEMMIPYAILIPRV